MKLSGVERREDRKRKVRNYLIPVKPVFFSCTKSPHNPIEAQTLISSGPSRPFLAPIERGGVQVSKDTPVIIEQRLSNT